MMAALSRASPVNRVGGRRRRSGSATCGFVETQRTREAVEHGSRRLPERQFGQTAQRGIFLRPEFTFLATLTLSIGVVSLMAHMGGT